MLYENGTLTIEQANQIIGEKMMQRIAVINNWIKENRYMILMHSTFKGIEQSIFQNGLYYPARSSFDSRDRILDDSNVPEKDLKALEEWAKNNHGSAGILSKVYETYPPAESSTVCGFAQINAKKLLEYNHLGGNMTIILCVPRKDVTKIGREISNDDFRMALSRSIDPYLRRAISCKQDENGEFKYKSKYFYPSQGILCAFDRNNIRIKFNQDYDETFYLDANCTQIGKVHKGDLLNQLNGKNKTSPNSNSRETIR